MKYDCSQFQIKCTSDVLTYRTAACVWKYKKWKYCKTSCKWAVTRLLSLSHTKMCTRSITVFKLNWIRAGANWTIPPLFEGWQLVQGCFKVLYVIQERRQSVLWFQSHTEREIECRMLWDTLIGSSVHCPLLRLSVCALEMSETNFTIP